MAPFKKKKLIYVINYLLFIIFLEKLKKFNYKIEVHFPAKSKKIIQLRAFIYIFEYTKNNF